MKIIVYQVSLGCRDIIKRPLFIPKGVDYWAMTGPGTSLDAKRYKILPHLEFPNHDVSVWMDGNFQLTGDIRKVVKKFLKHSNFAVLRHPAESLGIRPTVYREAEVAVLQKVDTKERIMKQIEFYRAQGLPEDTEVVMNGILIRRHNNLFIKTFDNNWWWEIQNKSSRDQISFPYLAWKYRLKYTKMDNIEFKSDWFVMHPHTGERKYDYSSRF